MCSSDLAFSKKTINLIGSASGSRSVACLRLPPKSIPSNTLLKFSENSVNSIQLSSSDAANMFNTSLLIDVVFPTQSTLNINLAASIISFDGNNANNDDFTVDCCIIQSSLWPVLLPGDILLSANGIPLIDKTKASLRVNEASEEKLVSVSSIFKTLTSPKVLRVLRTSYGKESGYTDLLIKLNSMETKTLFEPVLVSDSGSGVETFTVL